MPQEPKRPIWGVFCQHDEWYVKNRSNGRITRITESGDAGRVAALELADRLNDVRMFSGPTKFIVQLIDRSHPKGIRIGRTRDPVTKGTHVTVYLMPGWDEKPELCQSSEGHKPWSNDGEIYMVTKVAGENIGSSQSVLVWDDRPGIVFRATTDANNIALPSSGAYS